MVPVSILKSAEYNSRKWDKEASEQLKESLRRFGLIAPPVVVNSTPERMNAIIGNHFR